ncbi:flavin reductase family protein [Gordonia jinhuaensis]|uniref:Flavin oxidoreductase n=1 Tax=Gordonia jinhuaensis TaxID=1517702 RepID=A0A916THC2_9ACTN|nr:flavin reductase family protein [Gordonia jinhuaensis]GGB45515.1 flavin oxidoreductase [Gordonia jinhuaensis]
MRYASSALARSADFRTAFRHHPAGVAIVAAATPEGHAGLTVSSLASVAVDPCVVSFSVTSSRGSAGAVLAAPVLGVSLLDSDQVDTALAFAQPGAPRFTPEQDWVEFDDGAPYLRLAHAALRCAMLESVQAGSSTLVLAEVFEVRLGQSSEPMVYHDRDFHQVVDSVLMSRQGPPTTV